MKRNMLAAGFTQPAEFEPQSAVWMGWPTEQWYTDQNLDSRIPLGHVIGALQSNEIPVQIMCTDEVGEIRAKAWLTEHGIPISPYLRFLHIDQVDIWQRDFGPIFLRNEEGTLGVCSFQQNQWGYSTTTDPISQAMAAVPGLVAESMGIEYNYPVDIVSEGGDRIVNGQGTLLVNRTLEMERNPQASQEELEEAYKAALGVEKVIWLLFGALDDPHATWGPVPYEAGESGQVLYLYGPQSTGGHLDEFVRFVDANTIALAQVSVEEAAGDPIMGVNYDRFEQAYRILSAETDQDGNPFTIVRFPVPDPEYMQVTSSQPMYQWLSELPYAPDVPPFPTDGSSIHVVKAGSYANYLVTNGVVIAPSYDSPVKDNQMRDFLANAYGRGVVQIDPSNLNYAGGGIHCCTQQQPIGSV